MKSIVEEKNKEYKVTEGLYVTVAPRCFQSKEGQQAWLTREGHKFFKEVNINRTQHLKIGYDTFPRLLIKGYVHVMGDYIQEGLNQKDWTENGSIRINALMYDFDCGVKIDSKTGQPKESNPSMVAKLEEVGGYQQLEKLLAKHFHLVQRSSSWTEKTPRYHAYMYLDGVIENRKHLRQVHDYYFNKVNEALGFTADPQVKQFRPIFAGKPQNLIKNYSLPKYSIPQEVEDIQTRNVKKVKREGKLLEKLPQAEKGYKGLNIQKLADGLEKLSGKLNHQEWLQVLSSIRWLCDEGYISHTQAYKLAEILDDGTGDSEDKLTSLFERYNAYPYNIETILDYFREHKIETKGIINGSFEVEEFRRDKVIVFKEQYLGQNNEVVNEIREILSPKYRNKRVLIVANTGRGKSNLIIKELHRVQENNGGIQVLVMTRQKLKDNQAEDFLKEGVALALDGTQVQNGEISEEAITKNNMFITTYDYAPKIMNKKAEYCNIEEALNILVTDEVHMTYTDTEFKLNTVKDYYEQGIQEMLNEEAFNGIVLDITATPEFLNLDNYDYVVEFKEEEVKIPFKSQGYVKLSNKVEESKEQVLASLMNSENPVLCFIENKKVIDEYAEALKKEGKSVVVITADTPTEVENLKPKHGMTKEDIYRVQSIVLNKTIPNGVDFILATSTIGAGVSINNNTENWETWIVATSYSYNYCPIPIKQYGNRLRNQYNRLLILITDTGEGHEFEYPFHRNARRRLEKGYDVAISVDEFKESIKDDTIQLTSPERKYGLYYSNGTKVLTEAVYSRILEERKSHNYKNPKCLINYLSRNYGLEFKEYPLETNDKAKEVVANNKAGAEEKKIIKKKFKEDPAILEDIVNNKADSEYYAEYVPHLGKGLKERLNLALSMNLPTETVKSVIYKPKFKKDFEVYSEMKTWIFGKTTIEELFYGLSRLGIVGKEFNSIEELKKELSEKIKEVEANLKRNYVYTANDLLNYYWVEDKFISDYSTGKKVNNRVYRIKGLKNDEYLKETYGIDVNTLVFLGGTI